MRVSLISTPQRLTILVRPAWIILRVTSGEVRLSDSRDQLMGEGEGGLSVLPTDNIVDLHWELDELWARGAPNAVLEILIP